MEFSRTFWIGLAVLFIVAAAVAWAFFGWLGIVAALVVIAAVVLVMIFIATCMASGSH